MKRIVIVLFLSVLYVGQAKSDYRDEYNIVRASFQFSVVDYAVTPLELRLATLEALRYLHWKAIEVDKNRIVSVYEGRYMELIFKDDEVVTMRELPKNNGRTFNRSWLPNLEHAIVDQIHHMRNVGKMKSYTY